MLRGVPARFVLKPGEPAWEVAEISGKTTTLFSENVPCERLAHAVILDRPDAPVLVHTALRLGNYTNRPWPPAPLGRTMLPATQPREVVVHVLEEPAPLRLSRRIREISRPPPPGKPRWAPVRSMKSWRSARSRCSTRHPRHCARWCCAAAPDVVEETAPAAAMERDAAGARWMRWEISVPPYQWAPLEFRYRALAKPEPPK